MSSKSVSLVVVLALAAAIMILAAVRVQSPSLSGRWRDRSPAALLYEFRDDGSVWLIRDGQDLPVFRYEVEGDLVRFHDGMGRPRAYIFSIQGNSLILRDPTEPSAVTAEYLREPGQEP